MDIKEHWENQLIQAKQVLAGIKKQIEGASSEDLPQDVKNSFLLRLGQERDQWSSLVLHLENKLKN